LRRFSSNEKHLPVISDPEIESAFKDLMASSWSELPDSLVAEAKKAVSKATEDKVGQEVLQNVFCAAEASEEFGGALVTLRMALDDLCGLTGEVSISYLSPNCSFLCSLSVTSYRTWVRCLAISKMLLNLHTIATRHTWSPSALRKTICARRWRLNWGQK
jgi:hypothetical protein